MFSQRKQGVVDTHLQFLCNNDNCGPSMPTQCFDSCIVTLPVCPDFHIGPNSSVCLNLTDKQICLAVGIFAFLLNEGNVQRAVCHQDMGPLQESCQAPHPEDSDNEGAHNFSRQRIWWKVTERATRKPVGVMRMNVLWKATTLKELLRMDANNPVHVVLECTVIHFVQE